VVFESCNPATQESDNWKRYNRPVNFYAINAGAIHELPLH